jgi:predicted nicotinamide N-methyase
MEGSYVGTIYNLTDDLSIKLVELPKLEIFPTCKYCGRGNFWNECHPAASALSRYLTQAFQFEKKKGLWALIIGSGVGLEGIALSKMGYNVAFFDHIPDSLELVSKNCLLNDVKSFQTICCCWQDSKTIENIGKYDLVIGSDILYYPDEWNWIESLLNIALKPKGMALFSEPIRSDSMDFFRHLAKTGYRIKWADPRWASEDQRVLIYCIEKQS